MQASLWLSRYRWFVFLLALSYWFYQFEGIAGDGPGWQFRYLTIWALTASVISAYALVQYGRGRAGPPYVIAATAAVMNALVVLLYWRLYLIDPALVRSNDVINPWQEYYLHLAGPVLQWVDALILFGAFRKPIQTFAALFGVFLAYVGWAELVVAPLNERPVGSVTTGLPYPFLNNMNFLGRVQFYLQTFVTLIVFLGLGCAVTWARNRLWPA